jgi:mxaL protein
MRATRNLLRNALDRGSLPLVAALVLLLAALVLPTLKLPRATYTYIVFFDITQSMNVQDYQLDGAPISRLDYARQAVREALRALPCGSRIGLGAFAEYRTLLLVEPIEICGNYADLLASIGYIDGRMRWRDSSEITKGVFWSIRAALEVGDKPNVIFLTDGQEAPPLRPGARPNFEDVKPGQINGWLIGVGGYAERPIPRTDREGKIMGYWQARDVVQRNVDPSAGDAPSREHLSSLREAHLQQLAQRVGFDYVRLSRVSTLSEAMLQSRFAQRRPVPTDVNWLPAFAALLALVWRFAPEGQSLQRVWSDAKAWIRRWSRRYPSPLQFGDAGHHRKRIDL